MRKLHLCLMISALYLCTTSFATRTLKVAPISLVTVHGGALKDSSGNTVTCVSSGMTQIPIGLGGVICGFHQLNFHFKNLSLTKKQTISVQLTDGTYLISANSNGSSIAAATFLNKSSFTLNKALNPVTFVLDPDGFKEYRIIFACDSASCKITDSLKNDLYSQGNAFLCDSTNKTSPDQVCIDMRTLTNPVITVAEDEGAVVGTITTVTHRVGGWTDVHLTSPASYPLNGGRPF